MDDYQALIQEAKALLVQKRYDLALETATRAVRAESRRAMPYIVRAEVLRKLGQHDRALADVAVAIRIEPDRASPFVIRAEILKKRCLFDQAIADATEAIFLDPDNAAAYAIRADCRLAIGDADGAAHDAQELFRIDPTRPPSIPPSVPNATEDDPGTSSRDSKRSGGVPRVRDDSVFADGNAVDRSLKARKAISSDDAAEMLADASGYRPEIIATPLRRIRPPRSRSGKPPRLVGALIGIGAVLGVILMLTMRKQPDVRVEERIVAQPVQPVPTKSEVDRARPVPPEPSVANVERWEPPILVAYPDAYFIPLFSGRTIDGPLKDMSNCWLEDRFSNFVLRFEYRVKSHANQPWSGVRLRHGGTSRRLSLVLSEGMSGGLLLDQSLPGVRKPLSLERLDDAHRIIRPAHDADKPFGAWNRCEVVCDGSRTTVSINGEVVNHITNGPSGTGMICLSGFETGVAFRKLRVMKLNTSAGSSVAPSPPQTVTSDPPLNAATFEGHSYLFFPDVESWHGAKTRCEKMGGHLATIGSRAENDFVLGLARRGIERLGKLDGVWLGATDEVRENRWEWVDGSKSSFTKWDPGQPNNKNGEEHYLLLWLSPGLWVDQPDISKQHVTYFVCEWDQSK